MLTTIKNWLLGIEHDVESLLAPLTDMVKRLESHADAKAVEAAAHTDAAAVSVTLAAAAAAEADTAKAAAAKIGALVS